MHRNRNEAVHGRSKPRRASAGRAPHSLRRETSSNAATVGAPTTIHRHRESKRTQLRTRHLLAPRTSAQPSTKQGAALMHDSAPSKGPGHQQ